MSDEQPAPLYADRDHLAQGNHYTRHVMAMTAENLHRKSAIAGELAHRDMEIERLRSALAELVAVKDLKERTEALHFAGPLSSAGEAWQAEYEAGRKEYIRRQPAAWDAARAAISAT